MTEGSGESRGTGIPRRGEGWPHIGGKMLLLWGQQRRGWDGCLQAYRDLSRGVRGCVPDGF